MRQFVPKVKFSHDYYKRGHGFTRESEAQVLANMEKVQEKPVITEYAVMFGGGEVYYAWYVHEDEEAAHRPPTSAKYIEIPLRTMGGTGMVSAIAAQIKAGVPMEVAIYEASIALLIQAKKIVPVDTGLLKSSGRVVKFNEGHMAPDEGGDGSVFRGAGDE